MQADGREEQARRARRVLWAFRLGFYPAAVVVAAVLLLGRGDAAAEPVTILVGRTTQGSHFAIHVNRDGEAAFFDTTLVTDCGRGDPWRLRWWPGDGNPVPFDQDGRRLEVQETFVARYDDGTVGRREFRLVAEVDGKRASGVMTAVEHVDPAEGTDFACDSGGVGFTAQR